MALSLSSSVFSFPARAAAPEPLPPGQDVGVLVADAAVVENLYTEWLQKREAERKAAPKGYNPCSCVSYAKYRSGINVGPVGRAKNHPVNQKYPSVGAIAIFSISSGYYKNTGHAAVVESVDLEGFTFTVSEANYIPCKTTTRKIPLDDPTVIGYYFQAVSKLQPQPATARKGLPELFGSEIRGEPVPVGMEVKAPRSSQEVSVVVGYCPNTTNKATQRKL